MQTTWSFLYVLCFNLKSVFALYRKMELTDENEWLLQYMITFCVSVFVLLAEN
jgi:hypothetical protein